MSDADVILEEISEAKCTLKKIESLAINHDKQIKRILKILTKTSNIIKNINTPLLVELEMMKAANQIRMSRGESLAYSDSDFERLMNKYV